MHWRKGDTITYWILLNVESWLFLIPRNLGHWQGLSVGMEANGSQTKNQILTHVSLTEYPRDLRPFSEWMFRIHTFSNKINFLIDFLEIDKGLIRQKGQGRNHFPLPVKIRKQKHCYIPKETWEISIIIKYLKSAKQRIPVTSLCNFLGWQTQKMSHKEWPWIIVNLIKWWLQFCPAVPDMVSLLDQINTDPSNWYAVIDPLVFFPSNPTNKKPLERVSFTVLPEDHINFLSLSYTVHKNLTVWSPRRTSR